MKSFSAAISGPPQKPQFHNDANICICQWSRLHYHLRGTVIKENKVRCTARRKGEAESSAAHLSGVHHPAEDGGKERRRLRGGGGGPRSSRPLRGHWDVNTITIVTNWLLEGVLILRINEWEIDCSLSGFNEEYTVQQRPLVAVGYRLWARKVTHVALFSVSLWSFSQHLLSGFKDRHDRQKREQEKSSDSEIVESSQRCLLFHHPSFSRSLNTTTQQAMCRSCCCWWMLFQMNLLFFWSDADVFIYLFVCLF